MSTQPTEATCASSVSDVNQLYRYRNSRPWSVLCLSLIASVIAVAVIAGAWAGLSSATDQKRIAPPPDLRKAVSKAEQTGEEIFDGAKTVLGQQRREDSNGLPAVPGEAG